MTKTILGALALTLALPLAAAAAEIHGTVSEDGKPVPKGVGLKLACGATTASAATDDFGGYSLKVATTGDCTLSIDYKGASGSLKVAVYDKPSRYDIAVKPESGKLALLRK